MSMSASGAAAPMMTKRSAASGSHRGQVAPSSSAHESVGLTAGELEAGGCKADSSRSNTIGKTVSPVQLFACILLVVPRLS